MASGQSYEEILVVHYEHTEITLPTATAPGRVLQRFGDRVEIRLGTLGSAGEAVLEIPGPVFESLSVIGRFGVQAFQMGRGAAKARPRDGEVWDMAGCAPHASVARRPEAGGSAPAMHASALRANNYYLVGSVALGVVIVNGPTVATRFTDVEQTYLLAKVQAGTAWLAKYNPSARVSFDFDIRPVSITTQPDPAGWDGESRFRDPALAALGFQANDDGVIAYVNWLRNTKRTDWAYCAFFVKGYRPIHFAYARPELAQVVMDYANDGWKPENIDRVFAHETCHIFGCPDEYSERCDCGGAWGRFGWPNTNCENCASAGGVGCLMRKNEWLMCGATKRHLGWEDPRAGFVGDGAGKTLTAVQLGMPRPRPAGPRPAGPPPPAESFRPGRPVHPYELPDSTHRLPPSGPVERRHRGAGFDDRPDTTGRRPGWIPTPDRPVRSPRRRRWPKVLGVGLVVMFLLLIVGDRIGVRVATGEVKKRIEFSVAEQSEPNTPVPTVTDVSLDGFPFLTQVLVGNFQDIRFTIEGVSTPGPRIQQVRVRLQGVHVPLGDAIRDHVHVVPVDEIQGSVLIAYGDLNAFLAQETADDEPFRNVTVRPVGDGSRMEATAEVNIPVVGTQTVKGVAALSVTDGVLSLAIEQLRVAGTFDPSFPLPSFDSIELPLPSLPFDLRIIETGTDATGLSLTARAIDVALPAG